MKDKVIGMVLCVVCLAVTVLLGFGVRAVWRDHDRMSDAERWTVTTGRLESLTIVETFYRSAWQYRIECEYSYAAGGVPHRATVFDLKQPYFDSRRSATLFAEAAIDAREQLVWTETTRGALNTWVASPLGRDVRVRHSPRYPDTATLTDRPPLPSGLSWIVILVLVLLTTVFALATVVFAVMPFVPESATPPAQSLDSSWHEGRP